MPVSVFDPLPREGLTVLSHEGNEALVEHPDSFVPLSRRSADIAAIVGLVQIPLPPPLVHDAYSLAEYQTPIRNQRDRGTCYAFASIAAEEAAYKRKYGLELDLSEHYAFQLGKVGELYPDYATSTVPHESNCSFWGFQGNSGFLNVLQRSAVPPESQAPYLSQTQLEAIRLSSGAGDLSDFNTVTQEQIDRFEFAEANVPTAARSEASYRVASFAYLPDVQIQTIENAIAADHEVVVDINVMWRFDQNQNAYVYDPTSAGGGHVTLVVGYDRTDQVFIVKNSWGESDFIRVTYEFMRNCALAGTYITDVVDPNTPAQKKAYWIGHWNMDHDGWRGTIVFRRFTDYRNSDENAATKLGNYYHDDGSRYDVNGYFTEDGLGAVFTVAADSNRVLPGTLSGQEFDPFVFTWDPVDGAGRTTWQGTPYGVLLKRQAIPGMPGSFSRDSWIGSWEMNHDGWRGVLQITGFSEIPIPFFTIAEVNATYTAADGSAYPVTGTLDLGAQHHLSLQIAFTPGQGQSFDLYHHTWEVDNFSGYTYWGGLTFGVQGHRS
jgi:hypothetical protein